MKDQAHEPLRTDSCWSDIALDEAERFHEDHFEIRRAIWPLGPDSYVLLDNNPNETRNFSESLLRKALKAAQMAELAVAVYPSRGSDAGYTTAIVIEASENQTRLIEQLWLKCIATAEARPSMTHTLSVASTTQLAAV